LRALLAESQIELPPEMPPMAAGLIGYLGYDTVRLMEKLPEPKQDVLGVPDGMFMRPTIMAIFDSVRDTLTLVTPVWPDARVTAEVAYELARERLADAMMDIDGPVPLPHEGGALATATPPVPVSNTSPERYREMVAQAKEYIAAGDIFQVVLSQRLAVPFRLPPFALYRALRRTNPSPFMVHLDFGSFAIVASSPEILVRLRDGVVTIRPIAGTRPRGADAAEDARLADELLADPKELAEHLMLLDLGRNDVGRVARIGSVRVTEKMIIERYSHVMHIVSNVEGAVRPEVDAISALSAGFPAGTVSGAPKIRAMEIIHELEAEKRGVYGGGMGYFSANGTMDSCIALRTAVVKDGVMYVQAGAGIVADSNAESEHQECLNKARALVRAAEEAVRFARRTNR
jgi:anthranilate synthase component 1